MTYSMISEPHSSLSKYGDPLPLWFFRVSFHLVFSLPCSLLTLVSAELKFNCSIGIHMLTIFGYVFAFFFHWSELQVSYLFTSLEMLSSSRWFISGAKEDRLKQFDSSLDFKWKVTNFDYLGGYFPWIFMGFQVLMGSSLFGYLAGLFCGHLYIVIKDIYLPRYHKDYLPTPAFLYSIIYSAKI